MHALQLCIASEGKARWNDIMVGFFYMHAVYERLHHPGGVGSMWDLNSDSKRNFRVFKF